MLKLFKKTKDKIPKSEIITEPKEPKTPPVSKCGKPLLLDNTRWEASTERSSHIYILYICIYILQINGAPNFVLALRVHINAQAHRYLGEFMGLWFVISRPAPEYIPCLRTSTLIK